MQNDPDKKTAPFRKFLKEKGYYIVLFLCVAAVGVSGYLFVRTAAGQSSDDPTDGNTLSVPLTPSNAGTDGRFDAGGSGNTGNTGSTSSPGGSGQSGGAGKSGQSGQSGGAATPALSETGGTPSLPSEDAAETAAPAEDNAAATAVTTVRPLEGETIGLYSVDALAYNETTQDWRTHSGIDIAAAAGAQVVSARAGTVSEILEDPAFGTTVVVSHSDGCETHYANLNVETAVAVGQAVKAGDVLGSVGDSATVELAQASHLHFAVYQDGAPVDPELFLN